MATTLEPRVKSFLSSTKNLKVGWLIAAGILALYIGGIRPYQTVGGINNSKATGLAAETRTQPLGLWHQMRILPKFEVEDLYLADNDKTAVAGFMTTSASSTNSQSAERDRKMVRTNSLDLVVRKPAEAAEQIRNLAEKLGGFLVSSQISGGLGATSGSLTIRVPAERFEEARAEIRKLSLRIDGDRLEAQDVTRDYVDRAAQLAESSSRGATASAHPEAGANCEGHSRRKRETKRRTRQDRSAAGRVRGALQADRNGRDQCNPALGFGGQGLWTRLAPALSNQAGNAPGPRWAG